MSEGVFHELSVLTRLKYDVERAKLKRFFERETALRKDIAELEAQRRSQSALPTQDLAGVRSIGADLAWRGWMNQKHAELNQALAHHLSQKENMIAELARAHGKKIAAEDLMINAKTEIAQKRHLRQADAILAMSVQRAHEA